MKPNMAWPKPNAQNLVLFMEKDSDLVQNNVVTVDFRKPLKFRKVEAQELDQKKHALFALWVKLGTVCVLFDSRVQGVKVPPEFSNKGDLRLNFCYDFRIADFNFNDRAVFATLSFDDGEYFCMVPWAAVYGIQSAHLQQGAVWFEEFPCRL